MAVAQFAEHVAEDLEEVVWREVGRDPHAVFGVYLVPVESVLLLLVGEIAVVLVDDPPQGVEVALGRVGILAVVNTGRESECGQEGYDE